MAKKFEVERDGIPIIHASRFGQSVRSIVLELLGYEADPVNPWLMRAFKDGNKYERIALKQLGIKFHQPFEDEDDFMLSLIKLKDGTQFYISASTDAEVYKNDWDDEGEIYPIGSFLEVKNMSENNFNKMKNLAAIFKHFPKYIWQVQTYLLMQKKHKKPEKGAFVLRNKVTKEIRVLTLEPDPKMRKQILAKGKAVAQHYKSKTVPDCDCKKHKWCRFNNACREERGEEPKAKRKEKQQVEIPQSYVLHVTGTSFRKESIANVLEDLRRHLMRISVKLEPEPENPYDPNAIKVVLSWKKVLNAKATNKAKEVSKSEHVGYIPAINTQHVKSLTEGGYKPHIIDLGVGDKPWVKIYLEKS